MFTKDQLINVGVEKLADIILSLCQNRPDIQKQLEITFAAFDSNPKKIIAMIKKEIAALKRSNRFIDLRGSGSLADKINQIRIHIMEDLLPKSPNQAVELLLSLLDLHEKTLERVDDSGGTVGDAFSKACAALGTAYEHATNSVEDIVKQVYDLFLNDGYGVFGEIILYFKDALGEEGLKQLKQKLERSFNKTGNFITNLTIKQGLENIADCQNDVDAYIQACSFTGELQSREHLKIAERLIKHCRGKEAIEWLDSIEQPIGSITCLATRSVQEEKMALKIQALDSCGDHIEAQAERQKLFDISLSPKVYNEILKCGEGDFIASWKSTAFQKAFKFPDSHVALNFFIEIKEFNQAAELVYQRIDDINGINYYTLRPIADILCKIDPLAATLLYRKMAESPLERTKSNYYHYAAKDLVTCHNLSSKITDWKRFKNHQLYFEELRVQYKRKTSFWPQYTSALNKRQKMDK